MKRPDGKIFCNRCGKSLGEYKTKVKVHYCTTCSYERSRVSNDKVLGFAGNNSNYMG